MNFNHYIFLTNEGHTFQPESESMEPDVENLQVIGFSSGITSKEAFEKLLVENSYLKQTSFNNVFCYELSEDYKNTQERFSIK
jgi:hypothetical protein